MDWVLNNPELPVIVVILIGAVISLWKVNAVYIKRSQDEADKARKDLVDNMLSNNKYLEEQLSEYKAELEQERTTRINDTTSFIKRLDDVTDGYKESLKSFETSMGQVQKSLLDIQTNINEQTGCLRVLGTIPDEIKTIKKDVDNLWKRQREEEERRLNHNGSNQVQYINAR